MRKALYLCAFTIAALSSAKAQTVVLKANDSHIHYMGRVAIQDSVSQLSWSGTSLKINFTGTSVKAVMRDETNENFYNVIVDGRVVNKIHTSPIKLDYLLVSNLTTGKHTLELFKRTEWDKGKTWFYEFDIDGDNASALPAPATKKRKIEFFGNSITCGYAVEDSSGKDRGNGPYENNYVSYAALTARHFNAEYYCTSKSGIGMMVSWFPLIMPEMYNRLDATDANSRWDFTKYTPDVVVINIFQNDSWIVKQPNNEQFKARFGTEAPKPEFIIQSYENFVKTIRQTYPKAQIICALGNMDATQAGSPWPGYVKQAVKSLHDKKIHTLFFPYKNTGGHPNVKEQQAMADVLIPFIEKNIKW